jgi:hypothetical protein
MMPIECRTQDRFFMFPPDSKDIICSDCGDVVDKGEGVEADKVSNVYSGVIHRHHVKCDEYKCKATLATHKMWLVDGCGEHYCEAHYQQFIPVEVAA